MVKGHLDNRQVTIYFHPMAHLHHGCTCTVLYICTYPCTNVLSLLFTLTLLCSLLPILPPHRSVFAHSPLVLASQSLDFFLFLSQLSFFASSLLSELLNLRSFYSFLPYASAHLLLFYSFLSFLIHHLTPCHPTSHSLSLPLHHYYHSPPSTSSHSTSLIRKNDF